MRCPCAKKSETRAYAGCCQPYHAGAGVAATPSALMRSRYSAFAVKDGAYLLATWHPSTRPAGVDFTDGQIWTGLKVLASGRIATADGGPEEWATVEFVARSIVGGQSQALREVSRFVRDGGRWFYVDGRVA
jgi:SEC-C motif domain protein